MNRIILLLFMALLQTVSAWSQEGPDRQKIAGWNGTYNITISFSCPDYSDYDFWDKDDIKLWISATRYVYDDFGELGEDDYDYWLKLDETLPLSFADCDYVTIRIVDPSYDNEEIARYEYTNPRNYEIDLEYTPKLRDFGTNLTFDISEGGYVIYDGSSAVSHDSSTDMLTLHDNWGIYMQNFMIVPESGYTLEDVTIVFNPWLDQTYTYIPEMEYDAVGHFYYLKDCLYDPVEDGDLPSGIISSVYPDGRNELEIYPGYMTTIHVNFKRDGGFIQDSEVNRLAVANWDTDGDGTLSIDEAAAVTSLGTVFKGNENIKSFDELAYFTGLTELPDQAFLNCTALESIKIPANVQTIGTNALSGCTALANIEVDEHNHNFTIIEGSLYTSYRDKLIQYATGKDAITYSVRPTTKEICRDAFYQSRLQEIVLPTTLRQIGYDAFGYSKALTAVDIPQGVTAVGDYAFDHCTALTAVSLPGSLTSLGSKAFNYCKKLEQVTLLSRQPVAIADNTFPAEAYANATLLVPSGSKTLYENAAGWRNFVNIVEDAYVIVFKDAKVKELCVANWDTNGDGELDSSEAAAVTTLGTVFKGQTGIKSFEELRFFIGLEDICKDAFNGCQYLKSVIIPENVWVIRDYGFYANYKLTDVTLPEGLKSISSYAFAACTALEDISLPKSLSGIHERAFHYDKKLASITLPENLNYIGTNAFSSCPLLKTVTSRMQTPCRIEKNSFTETTFSEAVLYVPNGKGELYRNTQYWSKFADIREMAAPPAGPSISAGDITVTAGESGTMTLSAANNKAMVSFQVDVALPAGVSLAAAAMAAAADFTVATQAMGGNVWRVLAYSTDNSTVKANAGALLTLSLKTEESLEPGEKTVTFQNFIMTDVEYKSIKLAYTTAKMTVLPAIAYDGGKGDVNLDGAVNVQDVVVLVNHLLGTTPSKFSIDNADTNSDGEVNVSDVSALVGLCIDAGLSFAAPAHVAAGISQMEWTDGLSLCIADAGSYVAAQMDITVDEGVVLKGVQTDGMHSAVWRQTGDNRYRLLLFSMSNDIFSASGSPVVFDAQGEGGLYLSDVLLVDRTGEGYAATVTGQGQATGIASVESMPSAPADVYGIDGRVVRVKATSLDGLPAGVYIMNGKKVVVK